MAVVLEVSDRLAYRHTCCRSLIFQVNSAKLKVKNSRTIHIKKYSHGQTQLNDRFSTFFDMCANVRLYLECAFGRTLKVLLTLHTYSVNRAVGKKVSAKLRSVLKKPNLIKLT